EALQLQARLMASRGDLAPAIERLQALIAQHPQADSTWLTLADLQLAAGQTQAARQSYASAIQLNPAGTQAYLSLLPL
ncbi:tetratricopeptide repeat protein, partial [Acinetobacter baumannii]